MERFNSPRYVILLLSTRHLLFSFTREDEAYVDVAPYRNLIEVDEGLIFIGIEPDPGVADDPSHGCKPVGGVLLQLSPHFKNEGRALSRLVRILGALAQKEHNLAEEFRH